MGDSLFALRTVLCKRSSTTTSDCNGRPRVGAMWPILYRHAIVISFVCAVKPLCKYCITSMRGAANVRRLHLIKFLQSEAVPKLVNLYQQTCIKCRHNDSIAYRMLTRKPM